MSIVTTYQCDKCGSKQLSPDQFWVVGVKAHPVNYTNDVYVSDKYKMHVCRSCLEKFGIHAKIKDSIEVAKSPTVEEIIVDIVDKRLNN